MIENAVRELSVVSESVTVIAGANFDADATRFIEPGRVAVPSHVYKVVLALDGDTKRMYAAVIPNAENPTEPLDHFTVTIDEVESRTGLDFLLRPRRRRRASYRGHSSPLPPLVLLAAHNRSHGFHRR